MVSPADLEFENSASEPLVNVLTKSPEVNVESAVLLYILKEVTPFPFVSELSVGIVQDNAIDCPSDCGVAVIAVTIAESVVSGTTVELDNCQLPSFED